MRGDVPSPVVPAISTKYLPGMGKTWHGPFRPERPTPNDYIQIDARGEVLNRRERSECALWIDTNRNRGLADFSVARFLK